MRTPDNIVMHKASRTLELVYGQDRFLLPFEFLRVFSPSAEVQGHTPEEKKLQVGKRQVTIVGAEPVGLYALKIIFSDGHDSGLYSWDYLENLCRNQSTLWDAYLKELCDAGASREPDDPANIPFMPKPKTGCGHH